jgi:hypothetical protein
MEHRKYQTYAMNLRSYKIISKRTDNETILKPIKLQYQCLHEIYFVEYFINGQNIKRKINKLKNVAI